MHFLTNSTIIIAFKSYLQHLVLQHDICTMKNLAMMLLTLFSCFDASGWISSIAMIRVSVAVAVVMMVVAGFFTVNAILAVILLKMVSIMVFSV